MEKYIELVKKGEEVAWFNLNRISQGADCERKESEHGAVRLTAADIQDAEERLKRFSSFIKKEFPETGITDGLIESPLLEIGNMKNALEQEYGSTIPGRLYVKQDSHLAIAGSIKARGGIYEVLKHAEDLAIQYAGFRTTDSYEWFASSEAKAFFSQYKIQVGSTGNLGMSIGIMSAALGFSVIVHMSADAKQWKKDLLREKGVTVIEYEEDYSAAVLNGRRQSDEDPRSYFVDDEKSVNLFLGYAVAASRLEKQFEEQGIIVDGDHPLIVYIPAGVGGAPGGVSFGLHERFGKNVHCFFVEPTNCPSVLLGMITGLHEKTNVRDFGLSGQTKADGLACASPSGLVTRLMTGIVAGEFTVEDDKLLEFLKILKRTEEFLIEPSSCAAFIGPVRMGQMMEKAELKEYRMKYGLTAETLDNAAQIVWATGGSLVPEEVWQEYLS